MSNIVNSQIDIHRPFGGVVPEVASRKHVENIGLVVEKAIAESGLAYADLDAVAVTNRPGLIGALLVGLSFAKAFAYGINKPLITVNHLNGHIYANLLEHPHLEFPAICLVVSGGHTSLLLMQSESDYQLVGATLDDAAGEAFDKVARFLGLGYPGGPAIQKTAESGQAGHYNLPRVFLNRPELEFSFSGLKTAVTVSYTHLDVYKRQEDFCREVDHWLDETGRSGLVLLGDGFITYRQKFTDYWGDKLQLMPPHQQLPRAASLGSLARLKALQNDYSDRLLLKPAYIRLSEAQNRLGVGEL